MRVKMVLMRGFFIFFYFIITYITPVPIFPLPSNNCDCHDITELLLKVALNTINLNLK